MKYNDWLGNTIDTYTYGTADFRFRRHTVPIFGMCAKHAENFTIYLIVLTLNNNKNFSELTTLRIHKNITLTLIKTWTLELTFVNFIL